MDYLTTLRPRPPYHFDLLLDVLARYAHPTLDIVHDGAYWRLLSGDGGPILVKVVSAGTPESPALNVYAVTGPGDRSAALADLRRVLPLDADRAPFYAFAQQEFTLWPVIEALVGLPELRTASVFEGLAQAIIEQQISWTSAQRAQRWLVEWAGERVHYAGRDYYAFPTPARIAAALVDDLKPLKITFKRMALLIDVARRATSGELDLEALRVAPSETAYQRLLAIKGIGPWTAVVALSRAFGEHFGPPHTDVGLQLAVNRYFFGRGGRASVPVTMETFDRYGPYAGLAAHYVLTRYVLDSYPRTGTA